MHTGSYRFKLGDLECISISDGSHDYTLEAFFGKAPKEQIEAALSGEGLPTDHITTPYTYLVVDTAEHRVLVDMGAGHLSQTTGHMVANLRAAGIDAASIDVVVITHAHPDHIGGTLDDQGQLVYPYARYYLW